MEEPKIGMFSFLSKICFVIDLASGFNLDQSKYLLFDKEFKIEICFGKGGKHL